MMNLNYLESFLSLSETLSFTETARRLKLTQPSVSRQIRSLEDELKSQLFIRDKHRVQLTREGKELRATVAPLFDEIQGAFTRSIENSQTLRGQLSVGCLQEVGMYFFFQQILEFQRDNPEIDFHVRYQRQDELLDLLREGEVDFAIVSRSLIAESIRSYRLLEERSVLVTRAQSLLEEKDLGTAPFVAYNKSDALALSFFKSQFPQLDFTRLRRVSSVNSHASMLETLLARDCFAVLPYFSVRKLIESKALKLVSEKENRSTLYLVHMENQALSRRNEVFRKFLMEKCKSFQLG